MALSWDRELALYGDAETVCGCDEAGRGPLAGPVVAAAVVLAPGTEISGLDDSKKLSARRREALFCEITEKAVAYSVALASVYEIEKYNILNSALLAMDRAAQTLCVSPSLALVDGNTVRGLSIPARAVVGGDGICPSVAAASVLAKVTRDRLMEHFDKLYPGYGFSAHKGYGTKAHYAAIAQLGPTPLHRMSFLKKLYER